jgi:hypothetical protein
LHFADTLGQQPFGVRFRASVVALAELAVLGSLATSRVTVTQPPLTI